jgi:hypothetical protein
MSSGFLVSKDMATNACQDDEEFSYSEQKLMACHRSRCNSSASTAAPGSSSLSFVASPDMSLDNECLDTPDSFGHFSLPSAETSEAEEELAVDPIDRICSPVHKAPRLRNAVSDPEGVMKLLQANMESATVNAVSNLEVARNQPHADISAVESQVVGTPQALQSTPPQTPRTPCTPRTTASQDLTPPPLVPSRRQPKPPMMRALESNSIDQVRAVLESDPDAANEPFWDHRCDHPLCFAVRLRCSVAIVQLLIDHKASVGAIDMHDRTPSQIVQQAQPRMMPTPPINFEEMVSGFRPIIPQASDGLLSSYRPVADHGMATWQREVSQLLAMA